MAKLTGQTIADSYDQLLIVDGASGITSSLQALESADTGGSVASLQVSTVAAAIDNPTASSATQGGKLTLFSDDGAALGDTHRLGVIEFSAAEDTEHTITIGARIEAIADAAWSASENGADMVFYTTDGNASQSEVLRLTADNYVGMGINPEFPLHVETSRSGNYVAFIKNTHASNGYGLKVFAGDDANVKSFEVGNYSGGNLFYIKGNGDAVLTGDLIMANTKGISFAATADAATAGAAMTSETLDDYEEGTWTPVPMEGGNQIITGTNSGSYTKIGRLVRVNASFSMNRGSATGAFTISGLPFTVGASPLNGVVAIRPGDKILWAGEHSGSFATSGTAINFYINPANTESDLGTAGADDIMKASTACSGLVDGEYFV